MTTQRVLRTLITGAGSGLGLETALQIAAKGHHVYVAGRNVNAINAAVDQIKNNGGSAEAVLVDLGDLASVRSAARELVERNEALDVLINNAAVLPPARRALTKDGFELAFGTGYLGHFALSGLLLPALLKSSSPRVVSVSSIAHTGGIIDFDDLQWEKRYHLTSQVYATVKLANLMFAVELDRRSNGKLTSVAAHPGISRTKLANVWMSSEEKEQRTSILQKLEAFFNNISITGLGTPPAVGAEALIMAALDENIEGGGYYGPTGFQQMRGKPGKVKPARKAVDPAMCKRLFDVSEELTGVSFDQLKR